LASCAEPKKVAGTFQQQLDLCIKHLQDLRASGPGAVSISAETRHALLEVMNPRRQSSDGTIEQVQAACASASQPLDSASAESTPTIPRGSYASVVKSVRGFSPPPPPSSGAVELGKFGSSSALREYPSGEMKDFQLGLLDRIGMPHLEFYKASESEHCMGTGCDSKFTTRNYGITTFPKHEWDVVMGLATPPHEHMLHNRKVPNIDDKWCGDHSKTAKKADFQREEVISVVLYTGPMYVVYNAILTRFRGSLFDNGQIIWGTLNGDTGKAKNLYPTTLNVLVSAVQKLSTVTVYRDDMLLYRGTGGQHRRVFAVCRGRRTHFRPVFVCRAGCTRFVSVSPQLLLMSHPISSVRPQTRRNRRCRDGRRQKAHVRFPRSCSHKSPSRNPRQIRAKEEGAAHRSVQVPHTTAPVYHQRRTFNCGAAGASECRPVLHNRCIAVVCYLHPF